MKETEGPCFWHFLSGHLRPRYLKRKSSVHFIGAPSLELASVSMCWSTRGQMEVVSAPYQNG